MDCIPSDWKCIDDSFEKDDFYETIQAPKWIDFGAPLQPVNDDEWFCGRAALRVNYAKDKMGYPTHLPSIGECKGGPAKGLRQSQASENENPNRASKVEKGAFKKPALFRSADVKEKKTKISTTSSSTLSEQVSLSLTGPTLEARESTFVFRKRNPTHANSTLIRTSWKDGTSVLAIMSGAKILKAGGTRTISRLPPIARNSHLTTSSLMPLKESTTNAKHMNGGVLVGTAACKPLRFTKDAKVAVITHTCRRRNDYKEEGTSKRMYPLKDEKKNDGEIQIKKGSVEGCEASIQRQHTHTEPKEGEEDSIQKTLEKFLENLRLLSQEEEAMLNVENRTSKQRLGHNDPTRPFEQCTKQGVVNELDPFVCTTLNCHRNVNVHPVREEVVVEHDEGSVLEQEKMTSNVVLNDTIDQRASSSNHEANAIINQKQDLKAIKNWQRHRGTMRKSSELNLRIKHDTRDHKHERRMVPQLNQQSKSNSTEKLHVMACGSKGKHHTKMKTTIAPFRLRTEERGALKGLGHAKRVPISRVNEQTSGLSHLLSFEGAGTCKKSTNFKGCHAKKSTNFKGCHAL